MKDWTVSWFYNVNDTTPKDHSLLEWLEMTKKPTKEFRKLVDAYRETLARREKTLVPCCTISAAFEDMRNLEHIKHKNNLICIDIDRFSKSKKIRSNPCIDMNLAKELLCSFPATLYCGCSVSGSENGLYAILVIDDSDDLIGYFEDFKERLSNVGINIDESCKDYTRLRFFSYDPEAYFNPDAKTYKRVRREVPKEVKKSAPVKTKYQYEGGGLSNEEKANRIVESIVNNRIDITSSYNDWVSIGAALASEFGETGRLMFHKISQFHKDYKYGKTNLKFDSCAKMSKINISTFFKIAADYGISYKS